MSDWSNYQDEGIILHELERSDDGRVPHEVSELDNEPVASGDFPIRLQKRIENNVGKSTGNGGLKVKAVIRAKEETTLCLPKIGNPIGTEGPQSHASRKVLSSPLHSMPVVHDITGVVSQDGPISNNLFKQCNVSQDLELIVENPSLGTSRQADGIDLCKFSVDNISADGTLAFMETDKDREDQLLYYDWHDISNFEDIDKMFRNCDPTFGQGSNMESQSWFPSSTEIYGLHDITSSGLQSSTLEFRATNSVSSHPNPSYLSDSGLVTNDSHKLLSPGYQSFEMITNVEQLFDSGRGIGMESNLHQVGNETAVDEGDNLDTVNMQMKHLGGHNLSHLEGNLQLLSSANSRSSFGYVDQKYLSSVAASPDSFPLPLLTKQNHIMYSESSSSLPIPEYQFQTQGINNLYQDGFVPTTSSIATDDVQRKKMRGPQSSKPSSQQKQRSNCKQQTGNDRMHMNVQHSGTHMDASVTQNSFLQSVYSDDMSVKAVTFKQLQDVMAQLDVRTKLCIRDSLYRLARSAEQRHNFSFTSNESSECNRGIYSKRKFTDSIEHLSVETETNPIDRSIAHLLFHRPSEIAPRSDDAILLESHMMSEQMHGPLARIQ